jgi:hypothetical protein
MATAVAGPEITGVEMKSGADTIWSPGRVTRPITGDELVTLLLDLATKHDKASWMTRKR